MNIEALDEAQGLTAEMVRQWLKTQAPRIKLTTNVMTVTGIGDVWTWPSGDTIRDAKMDVWLSSRVKDIALLEGRTVQFLLREINPRMRPWPSLEAVEAHEKNGGRWVSKAPGDELIRCMTLSADRTEEDPVMATDDHGNDWWACDCEGWTFWPIDAHGNKVRWPERDGVML